MNFVISRSFRAEIISGIVIVQCLLFSSFAASQQVIRVVPLDCMPVVDGNGDDWSAIAAESVPLSFFMPSDVPMADSVIVKAGWSGDSIYFLFHWWDDSKDVNHKQAIWNADTGKYEKSQQREDRFAIQFAIKGDYTTNWASGKNFVADMWHWKAKRSNPLGLAHDKKTIISTEKLLRSYKMTTASGTSIFIQRPSDLGSRLYSTKRYRKKRSEQEPTYILNENPTGSVADVRAKGLWQNNHWTLEMKRALATGNADDVVFKVGKHYLGGIAIFNHTEDSEHVISQTLRFELQP